MKALKTLYSHVDYTAVLGIWDSVQQNHPYDTLSNFQDKQKKSNSHIEMYG